MAKKKKDRWTLLAETAVELNEVLGLNPPIETQDVSEAELEKLVGEAATMVVPEDELTVQTQTIVDKFLTADEDFEEEIEEDEELEEEETEEDFEDEEEDFEEEVDTEDLEPAEEASEETEADVLEDLLEEVENANKRKEMRKLAQANPEIFGSIIEQLPELETSVLLQEAMVERLEYLLDNIEDEPKPKPKAKAKEKKASKPAPKKKPQSGGKSMVQQARDILTPLLEEGGYNQTRLRDILVEEGITKSTAATLLSDSKNPDYNKFDRLVVEDEHGNLKFEE